MVMSSIPALLVCIYEELMETKVVYSYMLQNAPTEEARRLVEMNFNTTRNTIEALETLYKTIAGDIIPPCQYAKNVPVFTDFMEAARYAFMTETQLIRKTKDLYCMIDPCYQCAIFGVIVEHQLNAMRLLYLDLF